jgi:tRNA1(Val) A37 N6-methylase TrmN6
MNFGPMTEPSDGFTDDAFLGGRLRLRQPKTGHRAGHDAILLAAATAAHAGDRVADFGAGVGAAGLAVARRVGAIRLVLVELDEALAALARHNAALNAIEADVIAMDIAAGGEAFAAAELTADRFDVVLMNPPFNQSRRHRASPDKNRKAAHLADATTLEHWTGAARRVLKTGGVLTLIWRADALSELLAALDRGFGSLTILPVHGSAAMPAIRVLVRAIKGGRAPSVLCPGLVLNDESGLPNKQVAAILAGKGVLPLALP